SLHQSLLGAEPTHHHGVVLVQRRQPVQEADEQLHHLERNMVRTCQEVAGERGRSVSHRQRQLLHVCHGRELLHAGQHGFDSALGGEGNPPLVLEHEHVGQSERAHHHVSGGRAEASQPASTLL
uniref:Uncharacterized protein n=1 Tax=Stegastes partitus TaxID=144197 RepID=A0A3B4ZRW7_9TELE